MPFVDTNSHLTTKLNNFDIKCHSNSERYDQHSFSGTKFRGDLIFLKFMMGGFPNERECSGVDWLDPLMCGKNITLGVCSDKGLSFTGYPCLILMLMQLVVGTYSRMPEFICIHV